MQEIVEYFQTLSPEELLDYLNVHFSHLVGINRESEWPVTKHAYDTLAAREVEMIEEEVLNIYNESLHRELVYWKAVSFPHYRREILRYGCKVFPVLLYERTGMKPTNPPLEVHSMMRLDPFAGDLYSGDMSISALRRGAQSIVRCGNYLDFGCSSGALTRNLQARFPVSQWYGCDPVKSSISWASEQFPLVSFERSEQVPPLPYESEFFDGVFGISIWSHFSEKSAMEWFVEMRRILKPGGFLFFTAHGLRSFYRCLETSSISIASLVPLLGEFLCSQFVFERRFENSFDCFGLEVEGWGDAYFSYEWISRKLHRDWLVLDFQPGLNQLNQDVYVLCRT